MPRANLPPTKSNYLALKRQLAFAQEGYDLLEQKRQVLIMELMSRMEKARNAERRLSDALAKAYAALTAATLDIGSESLTQAALAVSINYQLDFTEQQLMGLRIPRLDLKLDPAPPQFGITGTTSNTDLAMQDFFALLPLVAEMAELENAVIRIARELRKTQRRCNALSKIVIPTCKETIRYIATTLEERDRESFVVLKLIRDRLAT